ncbi:MLO-like protein 6 [Malania oleifera]|uniref:MLO-like protein 6 n=1 Tax=Malania oleifera TaxID=397392 RepID=UPI0025AE3DB5|nr:MLO-like protein 6 [Malania oleifera]
MGKGSLEDTPTWAVSILYLLFYLLSVITAAALNRLAEFLRRRKRKSFYRALGKIKRVTAEVMIMGFMSFFLTISGKPISKICVTKTVATSFLPCKNILEANANTTISNEITDEASCQAKGMVSLISRDGIRQLNIFLFVLAVFRILCCVLTMCLGITKIGRWQAWEEETRTLDYEIENDSRRFRLTSQTSFGQQHLKIWTHYMVFLWPVSFIRQLSGSISKADYFTLRSGFITAHVFEGSNFNFQRYIARAFDNDIEQVIGISFWIWIFSIFFIFFNAHEFYNYYWLPFIPLMILLVVGTKLEVIITEMCLESSNKNSVTQGAFLVNPNDNFFWFGRPYWLLYLLQVIQFQNSFQLAFFTWTWYEYGPGSCFNQGTADVIIRVVMGVAVQFLCGYVTLPLCVLVTQMGSGMKTAVFTDRVAKGIKRWHKIARQNLYRNRCTSTRNSSDQCLMERAPPPFSDKQKSNLPKHGHLPPLAVLSSPHDAEITEEAAQQNHSPTGTVNSILNLEITEEEPNSGEAFDGEISFASTWKDL